MMDHLVQFPITVKESAVITSVFFSPSSPHDFAVTSGPRVRHGDVVRPVVPG